MRLVYEATGKEVKVGDQVTLRDGEFVVVDIEKPYKPSSTGRVYVSPKGVTGCSRSYFPGVIDAHWVEREDQPERELGIVLQDGFGAFRV